MADWKQQNPKPSHGSPHSTPLPYPGAQPPPNKKPRLSPNSPSPYSSPQMANGSLPNPTFSNPHYGTQLNGARQRSPEAQQPGPPTGVMGPPSRPVDEKPVDVNDLADVLVGSGVDLKEEEAALARGNRQANRAPFGYDPGALGGQPSYFDPQYGHPTLSPNIPGSQDTFYGAGTFNQPAVPIESKQALEYQQRRRKIRRLAEAKQYHLRDPFLSGASIRQKVNTAAHRVQVAIPEMGAVVDPINNDPCEINVIGPDNQDNIVVLRGQSLIYSGSGLSEIYTLLSLAARDRIRSLIEDAAALAKGRRSGAHGVVPPDLLDLATGIGNAEEVTIKAPPSAGALKRSFSEANEFPTLVSESSSTTVKTKAYPNLTEKLFSKQSTSASSIENERSNKRAKRAANGLVSGDVSRPGSMSGTPIPGTPGAIGERAPDFEITKKPLSKKEQKRQADARYTEEAQHAATNAAMNMALGGSKKSWLGGKQKSWMTSNNPTNTGFGLLPRANSTPQISRAKAANALGAGVDAAATANGLGEFREDQESGANIQLRDLVALFDPETKEKRAVAKAHSKMKQTNRRR